MAPKTQENQNVEATDPTAGSPGFRMTRQRKVVYDVLLETKDHPTANEVFFRSKERMDGISLATVYNCLETLTDAGLVKQVNIDRSPSRYCPNLHEHAHFLCTECGAVEDIDPMTAPGILDVWQLPQGNTVQQVEVAMKGKCASCAAKSEENA